MLFFLHFFSSCQAAAAMRAPQPSFPMTRLFSSEKALFLMKHDLIPWKHVLIFVTFFATTRSKCNSSQRNGMTANLGGLQIDSFHVDEIEKIKEENQKISRR